MYEELDKIKNYLVYEKKRESNLIRCHMLLTNSNVEFYNDGHLTKPLGLSFAKDDNF